MDRPSPLHPTLPALSSPSTASNPPSASALPSFAPLPPPVVPLSPSQPPSSPSMSAGVLHRPIPLPLTGRVSGLHGSGGGSISIPSPHSAFTSNHSAFSAPSPPSHSHHLHVHHHHASASPPSSSSSASPAAPLPALARPSSLSSQPPSPPMVAAPPPLNTHSSLGSQASPSSGPMPSPLSATDLTPNSHNQPPSSARLSSTSSTLSDSAALSSPSMSGSIASTSASSPPSITRLHRFSTSSLGPSASQSRSDDPSHSSSTADLLSLASSPAAQSRRAEAANGQVKIEEGVGERAAGDEAAVEEEDEDDGDDDAVAMDDGEPPSAAALEEVGLHAAIGLTASQLAAVHKGTSCHQCKNTKQLKKLAFCANLFNKRTKPEKRVCRKKYCETCLKKFYNDNLADVVGKSWICASCRGVCCCAACTRTVKKKSGKALDGPNNGSQSSASSPTSSAHATPSSEKRSLAGQQMAVAEGHLNSLTGLQLPTAATAASVGNGAGMTQLAYLTQTALQEWNAANAGLPLSNGMNAGLLASPFAQQQLLMYSQFQQQQQQLNLSQLQTQQLFAQQQQQQAQLVAALHLQQQHQQHQQQQAQQMPTSPFLPVSSLVMNPATAAAFAQSSLPLSLPSVPLTPTEFDLAASMRLHSLHDATPLPAHLSPSASPATSPSTFPRARPGLPTTGKISSPSATKRIFLSHREWPYASSSPVSSSRAVSEGGSELHSPSQSTEVGSSSVHSTPLSGASSGRVLSGDSSQLLSRENSAEDGAVRMDDGVAGTGSPVIGGGGSLSRDGLPFSGEGRTGAFAAYSSRKDVAFSNLQRLAQKDVRNK